MFYLNETNKYRLFTQGVDMRKGVECLCGIVRTNHQNPLNGDVYVFSNKSRCLLKMLPKYNDTELQRKILQTDNECIIEKLVSELYNFSNDEIAYIENREP